MTPLEQQIDELIAGSQYAAYQADKEARILPLIRSLCAEVASRCPPYARFLELLGPPADQWQTVADIPPLPVSMFKTFLLSATTPDKVARQLHSSATTGQVPSRIAIDKTTAFRQARALVAILKEHVGSQRRPLLVLDAAEAAAPGQQLSARGAAIRGVANFASEVAFGLAQGPDGNLQPDWNAIRSFFTRYGDGPTLLFGFTFLAWSQFVVQAERAGIAFQAPQAILLHSGGWKKLTAQAVTKDEFSRRAAAVLGCPREAVLDFYGMIEVVGTVFVDCPAGNKHAPAFADVLIRRPGNLRPVSAGETGIIEVVSVLPTSYPGQAVITEDQGVLLGIDDCPCGRRGRYFRFSGRIEQAELRGCGDVLAQSREIR